MSTRRPLHLATQLLAGAALLAFARSASAQQPVIITNGSGGGGAFAFSSTKLTISDDAVRGMLLAHAPEVFDAVSEPQAVVLVIDANDQYVSSRVSKAVTITANGDSVSQFRTVVVGDSVSVNSGAAVITIRRDSTGTPHLTTAGGGTAGVFIARSGSGEGSGMFGSGYAASDVASMSMKRYAAGTIAAAQLIVTVVKLK